MQAHRGLRTCIIIPRKDCCRRLIPQRAIRACATPKRWVQVVLMKRADCESWTLKWSDIWRHPSLCLQLLLWSICDSIPFLANLHRRSLAEKPNCNLCWQKAVRWSKSWRPAKQASPKGDIIGDITRSRENLQSCWWWRRKDKPDRADACVHEKQLEGNNVGMLSNATGCKMAVDGKWFTLANTVPTAGRPDIIPWSPSDPHSDRRDRNGSAGGKVQCLDSWLLTTRPVNGQGEVAKAFQPSQNGRSLLLWRGRQGRHRSTAAWKISVAAERASYWVWMKREPLSQWLITTADHLESGLSKGSKHLMTDGLHCGCQWCCSLTLDAVMTHW